MAKILICDDEKDIAKALDIYLTAEGYETRVAYNGAEALDIINSERIDLILLDVMMPVLDGIDTIREIRQNYNMPVIFLSAKSEEQDKILGLNLGADDYVTKPFNMPETAAQSSAHDKEEKVIGGISLNDREKTVKVDGEKADLTPKEFAILRLLMSSPGRVFSIKEIYREVWKEDPFGNESTVSVHIRHLREKTEVNPAEPRYIKAVWGQGYKIEGGK